MGKTTSTGETANASLSRTDVMALYTGVLKRVSGGHSGRGGLDGPGYARRDFIEIGDTHLRNVKLHRYHDELLGEALGETVTLSVAGNMFGTGGGGLKTVVAIRTPGHGMKRMNLLVLTAAIIVGLAIRVFIALGIAAVAAVGYVVVYNLLDEAFHQLYLIAAGILIAIVLLRGVVYGIRVYVAWAGIYAAPKTERPKAAV
jgi:hypothetical protein